MRCCSTAVINRSIIITTFFYKIPPLLPLPAFGREKIPKGGTIPLFRKEGLEEIFRRYVFSIMDSLVKRQHFIKLQNA